MYRDNMLALRLFGLLGAIFFGILFIVMVLEGRGPILSWDLVTLIVIASIIIAIIGRFIKLPDMVYRYIIYGNFRYSYLIMAIFFLVGIIVGFFLGLLS